MKQSKSILVASKESHTTNSLKRYKIVCTPTFLAEAKKLAKKYHNIKSDFFSLRDQFRNDPITGNDAMGQDVYKVRMQITNKNQGQSGGARVIIQVKVVEKVVYVLSVYDKSVAETIVDKALKKLLAGLRKITVY